MQAQVLGGRGGKGTPVSAGRCVGYLIGLILRLPAGLPKQVLALRDEHLLGQDWAWVGKPFMGADSNLAGCQKEDRCILVMASPVEGGTAVAVMFQPVWEGVLIE